MEKTQEINEKELQHQFPEPVKLSSKYNMGFNCVENRKVSNYEFNDINYGLWGNMIQIETNLDITKGNEKYTIENKREFAFCFEGHLKSLQVIIQLLDKLVAEFDSLPSKATCHRILLIIYLYSINIDNSILITICSRFINRRERDACITSIAKIKSIFSKLYIYGKSIDDFKIVSMVFSIVLTSWEIYCNDASSQLEWFKEALNYQSTQLSICFENLGEKLINLEKTNLFAYFCNKIIQSKSMNTFFLFEKVSEIKFYESEINNNGSLVLMPTLISINPANYGFQFQYFWDESIGMAQIKERHDERPFDSSLIIRENICDFKDSPFVLKNKKYRSEAYRNALAWTNDLFHGVNLDRDQVHKEVDEYRDIIYSCILKQQENANTRYLMELVSFQVMTLFGNVSYLKSYDQFSDISRLVQNNFNFAILLLKQVYQNNNNISNDFKSRVFPFLSYLLYNFNSFIRLFTVSEVESIISKLVEIMNITYQIVEPVEISKFVQRYTSDGYQFEKERHYEYNFQSSESTNILETISFEGASAIAVEFDLKLLGEKIADQDITIVSDDHSYNQMEANSNNNYFNFGTCFKAKILNIHKKKFLLPGEEIRIIALSDQNRGQRKLYGSTLTYFD